MGHLTELETIHSDLSTILKNSNTALNNKGVSSVSALSGIASAISKIESGSPYATGTAYGSDDDDGLGSTVVITHNLGVKPSYVFIHRTSTSYDCYSVLCAVNGSGFFQAGNKLSSEYGDSASFSMTSTTTTVTLETSATSKYSGYGNLDSSYKYYVIA